MTSGNGHDPDDEITAVERNPLPSAKNPQNKAKLAILSDLTTAMKGRVDRLDEIRHDVARDPAPIHQITWNRLADILEEDGQDEIKAAASLR